MLAAIQHEALMIDEEGKPVPPVLAQRHAMKLHDLMKRDYRIVLGAGRMTSEGYAIVPLDITKSTPQAVYEALQFLHADAVEIQKQDVQVYLGRTPTALLISERVQGIGLITPSEILTTLRDLEFRALSARPQLSPDQTYLRDNIGPKAYEDEMVRHMERAGISVPEAVDLDAQQKRADAARAADNAAHDEWAASHGFGSPQSEPADTSAIWGPDGQPAEF